MAPRSRPRTATVKGTTLKLSMNCRGVNLCRSANVEIKGTAKPLKNVVIAKKTGVRVTAGKQAVVTFKLTAKARKAFKDKKKRKKVRAGRPGKNKAVNIVIKGLKKTSAKVTVRGWDAPKTTKLSIKRNGKVR